MKTYTPVIGLETHVELKTENKMFCQCSADYFGKDPNTNTCPVCLGLPGALPVPNRTAFEWTMSIAKALNCTISTTTKFDRKHYSYPDLPKGYQISQYDEPIGKDGYVELRRLDPQTKTTVTKKFRILRVHLEEDTGKLVHEHNKSLVDFNRSGVPLVEIVTQPDFESADDVKAYLEELHTVIRYLDVSDADMEKGSMRLEPNISVREEGDTTLPSFKVEVKNINSFNFVKKAIEYEQKRQAQLLEKGEIPVQETRGYNEAKGITVSQRTKEDAHDYRYFPEPDIPPIYLTKEEIDAVTVPELPQQRVTRYVADLKVKEQDAFRLTRDKEFGLLFEQVVQKLKNIEPQHIANLFINKKLKTLDLGDVENIVQEIASINESKSQAVDQSKLNASIDMVLKSNEDAVANYRAGKTTVIMFMVGQVMKEMRGHANAVEIKKLLEEKLQK